MPDIDILMSPKRMLTTSFSTLGGTMDEMDVDKIHTVFSDGDGRPVGLALITINPELTTRIVEFLAEYDAEQGTPLHEEDGHV